MIKINTIKYVWINGYVCIELPAGIISFTEKVIIKTTTLRRKMDFTQLQKMKERDYLEDIIKELRDRFKDKNE